MSWADLEARTNAVGNGVTALGLAPGDHVALMATNRVEFVEALLGCMRAGMVVTPVKTGWSDSEIAYLLEDAGSQLVITDRAAGRRAGEEARIRLLDLDRGYERWVEAQPSTSLPADRAGWRLPYTSGTTGRPKGVVQSNSGSVPFHEAWKSGVAMAARLQLPPDGWHLVVSRLFHGAPLNFALGTLASGAPLRIMRNWDAEAALDEVTRGCASTIMVPTMFRQLLSLDEQLRRRASHSDLRTVVHGGEPCPIGLKQRMVDWWGPIFIEYFGFTEGGMTLATTEEWLSRPGTVGKPRGQRVIIRGPSGDELRPGEEGRVYFSPPDSGVRNFAYRNDPDKTSRAHAADGSFTAGDIGWLDEEGYLYISGRESEVIVSAGVNIYPATVEAAILPLDGILDGCVVGGPDPERGECVVAVVKLAPGANEPEVRAAVDEACAAQLASYERPRRVIVSEMIPRDGTGKLLRSVVRAELWGSGSPFATRAPT